MCPVVERRITHVNMIALYGRNNCMLVLPENYRTDCACAEVYFCAGLNK